MPCLLLASLSFYAWVKYLQKSSKTHKHIIEFHNLTVDESFGQKKISNIDTCHFKHHDSCRPVCLQISPQSRKYICPVRTMVTYLEVRGNLQGPLLIFDGLTPIRQSFYTSELKNVISFIGLDCKNYKSQFLARGSFLCISV